MCLAVLLLGTGADMQAQKLNVIDTDFSKGQLTYIQQVRYRDLVRFHGHSCDGLLEGMQALQLGLKTLYPDGVVDRTNTRVVSKSSPCLTDAAVYLTGGRYQFGTFYVDDSIKGMYIIQRIDDGQTVMVARNQGVKPEIIDVLGKQAVAKKLNYGELRKLKKLEDDYSKKLKGTDPARNFTVMVLTDYKWAPRLRSDFTKTDIINKNVR
jgi:acetolactate decarboxylase